MCVECRHICYTGRPTVNSFVLPMELFLFFYLSRIVFIYLIFFKSGIHNVIKYLTVDLDACKQLFVQNSYKSAIKKIGRKKNHKSMIFGVI